MDGKPSLYCVEGLAYNKALNRLLNHGDDHGSLTAFTVYTAATSAQHAVDELWQKMEETSIDHDAKATRIIDEVSALKREGKRAEAEEIKKRALSRGGELGPIPPPEPKEKSRWRAREIRVVGYRIILEPISA